MQMSMKTKFDKKKFKRIMFGGLEGGGLLTKIFLYAILVGISFIFMYPLLKMIVTSFMGLEDLIDPTSIWIPSRLVFDNYSRAVEALHFWKALGDSLEVALFPTICAVISSSLIGYGFAHYEFPFKKLWFAALIIVYTLSLKASSTSSLQSVIV